MKKFIIAIYITNLIFVAMRIMHWSKNLLIFLPLILAHKITDWALLEQSFIAFIAFCLCASGIYIVNDAVDSEHDKQHLEKRNRPIASGALNKKIALPLYLLLHIASFSISFIFLPFYFTALLLLYLLLGMAYTYFLKRIAIADVIVLSGLYTIRILAGGFAIDIVISSWLLAFSIFFFFSLAVLKRHSELSKYQEYSNGRGYAASDLNLLCTIGAISGYLSILILMLYIHSSEVLALYATPQLLWLIVPLLLYWITRIWLLAERGKMEDDPVAFALKDPNSYLIAGLTGIILIGAI